MYKYECSSLSPCCRTEKVTSLFSRSQIITTRNSYSPLRNECPSVCYYLCCSLSNQYLKVILNAVYISSVHSLSYRFCNKMRFKHSVPLGKLSLTSLKLIKRYSVDPKVHLFFWLFKFVFCLTFSVKRVFQNFRVCTAASEASPLFKLNDISMIFKGKKLVLQAFFSKYVCTVHLKDSVMM